ncbi:MAG: hypothetical protein AAF585_01285 [Verrucomicrobiota bacterium]
MTEELRNQVLLYWSDELDPAERAAVESQIAKNAEMRLYLDELDELRDDIVALPDPAAAGAAEAALQMDAESKIVPFPTKTKISWAIGIAAAIALLIGVIKLSGPPSTTPEVVEVPPAPAPESTRPAKVRVFAASQDETPVSRRVRDAQSRAKRLRARLQG